MGVPFEAFLPYGIMLGVRCPTRRLPEEKLEAHANADVRRLWSRSGAAQVHAERQQEEQTRTRCMGQAKYDTTSGAPRPTS
ncbi:hypothetical protein BU16DRAFT_528748 [Lophium mytilinum]|uniref:Uncharacterized protein n=1 Tax=Lophium mytilinum TaxID=390894 RepID=A0A6A6QN78_9PEZI|nr:hypothetical protein BU16DRAFT_528748 [Lophium mytilinum]